MQLRRSSRSIESLRANPEKLSFSEALSSPTWRAVLEGLSQNDILAEARRQEGEIDESCPVANFVDDAEIDEEAILARFRDYMHAEESKLEAFPVPIPAYVLHEFLSSFGALDMSFWKTLPIRKIFSVTDGEGPITQALSRQLSASFGTRTSFWWDIQHEYDLRQSEIRYPKVPFEQGLD